MCVVTTRAGSFNCAWSAREIERVRFVPVVARRYTAVQHAPPQTISMCVFVHFKRIGEMPEIRINIVVMDVDVAVAGIGAPSALWRPSAANVEVRRWIDNTSRARARLDCACTVECVCVWDVCV